MLGVAERQLALGSLQETACKGFPKQPGLAEMELPGSMGTKLPGQCGPGDRMGGEQRHTTLCDSCGVT